MRIDPSPLRAPAVVDEESPASGADLEQWGPTTDVPLGTLIGARSGDKGGSANVGLWARGDDEYAWLDALLTVDKFKELIPEAADLAIRRYRLPNLRAINFVIEEILGRGVAENVRFDPQAKGLGEWLRSRVVPVPDCFLQS